MPSRTAFSSTPRVSRALDDLVQKAKSQFSNFVGPQAVTETQVAEGSITLAKMAASASNPAAGTAGLRSLGTTATTACAGNDSRLSDTRTPTTGTVPFVIAGNIYAGLMTIAAGTKYVSPEGQVHANGLGAATADACIIIGRACTISGFRTKNTGGATGATVGFTTLELYKNDASLGFSTAYSENSAQGSEQSSSGTFGAQSLAVGDRLSLKLLSQNGNMPAFAWAITGTW